MRQIRADGSRLDPQMLPPAERFIHSETINGARRLVCVIAALGGFLFPLLVSRGQEKSG